MFYELRQNPNGTWSVVDMRTGQVTGTYATQDIAADFMRQLQFGLYAPGGSVAGGQVIGGTTYPVGDPLAGVTEIGDLADATDTNASGGGSLAGADYGFTIGGDFYNPFNFRFFSPEGGLNLGFNSQFDLLDSGLDYTYGNFTLGGDIYNPNLSYDYGEGTIGLTGNTPTGTVGLTGSVDTPVGSISGSTDVPDNFEANTELGDIFEGAGDFLYNLFTDPTSLFDIPGFDISDLDFGDLSADQLFGAVSGFLQNPGDYAGQFGDWLQNNATDVYNSLFGGGDGSGTPTDGESGTPTDGGGGGTPTGGGGGSINPLLALLGGAAALFGGAGENTITQTNQQTQAGSPLLTGTDPLSLQFQSALNQQLTAPDVANNPYFAPALQAAFQPITQNFLEQILPAIRGQAVTTGNIGGSRQGIAEGLATRGLNQTLANAAAQAALQANLQGQQTQAQALPTAIRAAGGTGSTSTQNTTAALDPFTTFLSGLTGSLGLISEYNQLANPR